MEMMVVNKLERPQVGRKPIFRWQAFESRPCMNAVSHALHDARPLQNGSARQRPQRPLQGPVCDLLVMHTVAAVVGRHQAELAAIKFYVQGRGGWWHRWFDITCQGDVRLVAVFFFAVAVARLQSLAMFRQGLQFRRYGVRRDEQHFGFGEIAELTNVQRERSQAGHVAVEQGFQAAVIDRAEKGQGQMQIGHWYPAAAEQWQRSAPGFQRFGAGPWQVQGKKQSMRCGHTVFESLCCGAKRAV